MDYSERFEAAAADQGFEDPLRDSPIETPAGWHGGEVQQTGGWILCRIWRTADDGLLEYTGNDVEYECIYGQEDGVSINRFQWQADSGFYEAIEPDVRMMRVEPNTDQLKAQAAKALMQTIPEDR